jgi:hypothetical protein
MLFSLTETGSKNFGWLLWAALQYLSAWQSDKELFEKNRDANDDLSHDEFRNILLRWHSQLQQVIPFNLVLLAMP